MGKAGEHVANAYSCPLSNLPPGFWGWLAESLWPPLSMALYLGADYGLLCSWQDAEAAGPYLPVWLLVNASDPGQ